MKVIFIGTAEFGVPALEALVKSGGHEVAGIITKPDRPAGRGMKERISPVKERGLRYNIPLFQPEDINSCEAVGWISKKSPDAYLVVAYGQIISSEVLGLVKYPVNLHGSLLPDYRGAAPINWAVIKGEKRTGVTSMLMDRGMDTGPILLQKEINIGRGETAGEVHDRLANLGGEIIIPTLEGLELVTISPKPQPRRGTLAPKLSKEDGRIDWQDTSENIHNKVRGMNPWPGAFTYFADRLVKVHETRTGPPAERVDVVGKPGFIRGFTEKGILVETGGEEIIELIKLQPESKQRMNGKEFSNGYGLSEGDFFGD